MDLQATNVTNSTQVSNIIVEGPGFLAFLFFSCGIVIVICNITPFILYMRYAQKNVHGIFVMSLCNGNSLVGLSVSLAASNFIFIRRPYVCEGSLLAMAWGIIYNIAITFWISFNQFCIVHNLHYKDSLLEKRRFFIIVSTGIAIKVYLILLFLTTQDSDVHRCDAILVFRHFHPFYVCATSIPIVAFLVVTTILYQKTLTRMKKLAAVDIPRKRRIASRTEIQTVDLKVINEISQTDGEMSVPSLYGEGRDENGPKDTGVETRRQSNALSDGESRDEYKPKDTGVDSRRQSNALSVGSIVCVISPNQENTRHQRLGRIKDLNKGSETSNGRGYHAVQRFAWHEQAQQNVRMILIQVTIYGTSLIAGMLAASLGFGRVRLIINAIAIICILISPYQYVFKIPEVKTAMMKAFRCHPNSVAPQP